MSPTPSAMRSSSCPAARAGQTEGSRLIPQLVLIGTIRRYRRGGDPTRVPPGREAFDGRQQLYGRPSRRCGAQERPGRRAANVDARLGGASALSGPAGFLVQAGRPVGGRFADAEGKDLVLHPDVDEASDLFIQDLLYSGGLAQLGFVAGVGSATVAQPRHVLREPHITPMACGR